MNSNPWPEPCFQDREGVSNGQRLLRRIWNGLASYPTREKGSGSNGLFAAAARSFLRESREQQDYREELATQPVEPLRVC